MHYFCLCTTQDVCRSATAQAQHSASSFLSKSMPMMLHYQQLSPLHHHSLRSQGTQRLLEKVSENILRLLEMSSLGKSWNPLYCPQARLRQSEHIPFAWVLTSLSSLSRILNYEVLCSRISTSRWISHPRHSRTSAKEAWVWSLEYLCRCKRASWWTPPHCCLRGATPYRAHCVLHWQHCMFHRLAATLVELNGLFPSWWSQSTIFPWGRRSFPGAWFWNWEGEPGVLENATPNGEERNSISSRLWSCWGDGSAAVGSSDHGAWPNADAHRIRYLLIKLVLSWRNYIGYITLCLSTMCVTSSSCVCICECVTVCVCRLCVCVFYVWSAIVCVSFVCVCVFYVCGIVERIQRHSL